MPDSALDLLFRSSRGVLRLAARILRLALEAAHERDQNFVDDHTMEAAVDQVVTRKAAA